MLTNLYDAKFVFPLHWNGGIVLFLFFGSSFKTVSKVLSQLWLYTLDVTVYPMNHGAKHCELIRKESCLENGSEAAAKTYFPLPPNRTFSLTVCKEAFIISLGKRDPSKTITAKRSEVGGSLSLPALKPGNTGRYVSPAERGVPSRSPQPR